MFVVVIMVVVIVIVAAAMPIAAVGVAIGVLVGQQPVAVVLLTVGGADVARSPMKLAPRLKLSVSL